MPKRKPFTGRLTDDENDELEMAFEIMRTLRTFTPWLNKPVQLPADELGEIADDAAAKLMKIVKAHREAK